MASGDASHVAAIVGSGLVGLAIGSFLNVVVYRLPRGMSVVRPASHCPGCGTTLTALDTVPVVSWLALRGRCRHCGTGVSARYPVVEAVTGAAFAALAAALGGLAPVPSVALAVACALAAAVIDLDGLQVPPLLAAIAGIGALSLVAVGAATGHSGRDGWGLLGVVLAAGAALAVAAASGSVTAGTARARRDWHDPGRWGVLAAMGGAAGWLWAPGGALLAGWVVLAGGVAALLTRRRVGRSSPGALPLWVSAGGAFAVLLVSAAVGRA